MITSRLTNRADTVVSLLDLRLNKFSDRDVVHLVKEIVETDQHSVIAHQNLHGIFLWYHEPRMRAFYRIADYIHIDGMSLICLANLLGVPHKRKNCATALDYFPLLAEQAVKHGWRIFYLGSKPGVADTAAITLRARYPGLQIRTHHGHFDAERTGKENHEILSQINAYAPQILFVGMGMPRQEIWILENYRRLSANAIFPTGALMDYIAGEIPTAPRWLASFYLEWLYRLVSEPARLWRRYLVEPWFVFGQAFRHQMKFRSRNMTTQDNHND
jgi:N-acetylglucosaminyldiphosphoundecaprenol N-acetyl-beta-D-mannosaminyltransferase